MEKEEGSDADSQDNTTDCEAYCMMLLFGQRKQDEFIAKYGEEDWYDQISTAEDNIDGSYSATE